MQRLDCTDAPQDGRPEENENALVDRLTRELVSLTHARRSLLVRARRCLDLMAPRRRELAALLRARREPCHTIDRVGSARLVQREQPEWNNNNHHNRKRYDCGIGDVIESVSVLPFDDEHATLNAALDRALHDTLAFI